MGAADGRRPFQREGQIRDVIFADLFPPGGFSRVRWRIKLV